MKWLSAISLKVQKKVEQKYKILNGVVYIINLPLGYQNAQGLVTTKYSLI